MKAKRSAHDAIVEPSGGEAYDGVAGKTRLDRVHLVEPDGTVRSVEVYRVVNVATHPELKATVLAGQLHRLPDGRELALPFVYHDPHAQKFALVLPPALAHLELKEWSALMTEVAQDTAHAVPAYVRDSTTVLGIGALELFLEAGIEPDDVELSVVEARPADQARLLRERERGLEERERLVRERDREVAEQERNLVRMAESLTQREGALERRETKLAAKRAELEQLAHEAQVVVDATDGDWQEVDVGDEVSMRQHDERTVVTDLSEVAQQGSADSDDGDDASIDVQDSEVREVSSDEPETASSGRRTGPPPLKARRGGAKPPPLRPAHHLSPPPLPAKGRAAASSVAPAAAASSRPPPRSSRPPPLHSAHPSQRPSTPAGKPRALAQAPSVAPPEPFWQVAPGQLSYRLHGSELWLYVHQEPGAPLGAPGSAELLLQLCEREGYALVVLTLVDAPDSPGFVARVVLDGAQPQTRELLERLERAYRARLSLYEEGRYLGTHMVSALRETVARCLLDHLAERPERAGRGAPDVETVIAQVYAEPPPFHDPDLPFVRGRLEAATTSSVVAAVERLAPWLEPDALQRAMLTYSVPRHVIEASARRVLRAAIGYGVALPEHLVDSALSYGVASEREQLVRDQLEAFSRRVQRGDHDLEPELTAGNWQRLLSQAEQLGIESARYRALRAAADPQSPDAIAQELTESDAKRDLILQLCRDRTIAAIGPIVDVLDKLPPGDVAAAVAALLYFGETAGDALLSGLTAPSQHVRHACALGLGQLKLRRSLSPLLKQLEQESTLSWAEMARALGDFGQAGLRPLQRALKRSSKPERLMLGLVHLANHGCLSDVEKMEKGKDSALAAAAQQALARRARMAGEDQAVRAGKALRDDSAEARFSQAFFSELERLSI